MFRLVMLARYFVPAVTVIANVLFVLQTFVPVLKRQWYWDARHELHFSVHWEWCTFSFARDDVVVKYDTDTALKCAEAMADGNYEILDTVISDLKAKSRK
jgi:hypothetical protein